MVAVRMVLTRLSVLTTPAVILHLRKPVPARTTAAVWMAYPPPPDPISPDVRPQRPSTSQRLDALSRITAAVRTE